MADDDDPVEAARRLEQALERIARAAQPSGIAPTGEMAPTVEVAARLDALIAQLRAALANPTGA